ncbi:43181_t:CDS:2, partial [Gigaspora margarita]
MNTKKQDPLCELTCVTARTACKKNPQKVLQELPIQQDLEALLELMATARKIW